MKVVFVENFFDEIDHFHPNFDESVPNRRRPTRKDLARMQNERAKLDSELAEGVASGRVAG